MRAIILKKEWCNEGMVIILDDNGNEIFKISVAYLEIKSEGYGKFE